jgi:hypothetical protein
VRAEQLLALNHAGFIEFSASRPASKDASRPASNLARPEEKREELDLDLNQDQDLNQPPNHVVEGPDEGGWPGFNNGTDHEQNLENLADLLARAAPKDIPW